ncbi:MAG: preprotein translocase subunit SecA, partial [Beijerinckiaceae bacterium]|nr:preprotein translocase subunit SecA [Beijerinckiaceae bacterium]
GVPGAVTIATNMAGRGTDIQLGGNADMRINHDLGDMPEGEERTRREAEIRAEIADFKKKALDAGGLYVIGTERHESRRIDNQLRGRSGRQGDPGRSKFFLSLQDDLMRIFGSERMDGMLTKLGLKEDEAIIHPWINKAIEKAQQKVEMRNFDMRKNILKYDDVMNDQRKVVFEQRRDFMADESVRVTIDDMRHGVIDDIVARHIPEGAYPEQWDLAGLDEDIQKFLAMELPVADWAKEEGIADEEIRDRIREAADVAYAARVERNSPEVMTYVEKQVLLQMLDHLWREHLVTLDQLRQVIGWRGYAQRDPLNEYKSEAFELFNGLIGHLRENVTGQLMRIEVQFAPPPEPELPPMVASHLDPNTGENEMALANLAFATPTDKQERDPNDPNSWGRVGRNETCPCGSGKKYKHCHGQFA